MASALRRPLWWPALALALSLTAGLAVLLATAAHAPGRVSVIPPTAAPTDVVAYRVDINRATQAELEALPGIGEARAAKIRQARDISPFRSVDELVTRDILPVAVLDDLRALISAGP